MQVVSTLIPTGTLAEFAEANELVMSVVERSLPVGDPYRFYAKFDNTEVSEGAVLNSDYGNGATPEEAVADYARRISLRVLVVNAGRENRRTLNVWRLVEQSE